MFRKKQRVKICDSYKSDGGVAAMYKLVMQDIAENPEPFTGKFSENVRNYYAKFGIYRKKP